MASEIRVNKIENRSGLGTVTFADTGVDLAGIVTATTFSGSGASLTALPAAQVTGTLPAISGANLTALNGSNIASGTVADARISTLTASKLSGALPAISALNLTNVPAANVVGVHTSLTVTNATTTGTAVVGGGVTISESGIEASGIGITCANINGTQIGGRKNIVINGAMTVAQRGTSSTSSGLATVDRFQQVHNGTNEAPTQAQVDVASGTTPYTNGFRKAFKITNGNQSGGAGVNDYIWIQTKLESQDIANSGWNYTSSSSFITLQFWVKSSVAQDFKCYLRSRDGTQMMYPFNTGTLTADTWTKITKTISGNASLQFDNDANEGLQLNIGCFFGDNLTSAATTEDGWATWNSSARAKVFTTTWYTTNDATFEVTGIQLEVGPQATAFEHRSFHEERELCRRYYHAIIGKMGSWGSAVAYNTTSAQGWMTFYPEMRAAPTFTWTGTLKLEDGAQGFTTSNTTASTSMGSHGFSWWTGGFSSLVDNNVYYVYDSAGTGYFQLDAEL